MYSETDRTLADLSWPDVGRRAAAGAVLAIPLGSTEQHGPHLPLSTDTDVAVAVCRGLAASRDDVLVAPPVAYGSSGEHAGFPGTLSIGQEALELVLVELVRSAGETFAHVLLVCAHGGNAEPVNRAVSRLRAEGRDVGVFMPHWVGEPHAGRTETAMVLHLTPDRVHMDRAVAGDTRPLAEIMPLLRESGVRAASESGVLGNPIGAEAHEGQALLESFVAKVSREVAVWLGEDR